MKFHEHICVYCFVGVLVMKVIYDSCELNTFGLFLVKGEQVFFE